MLGAQPAARECAVVVREDVPGTKRLVAYLALHDGHDGAEPLAALAALAEIDTALRERLPDYMVPHLVELPALPLTANGKINRRALLAAPMPERNGDRAGSVAPRNSVEEVLADVWAEILRLERVGVHDNFFALGGDSILVIQAASRSRQRGVPFTPRQLFQNQTVARLAAVADVADLVAAEVKEAVPISFEFSEAGLSDAELDVLLGELSEP